MKPDISLKLLGKALNLNKKRTIKFVLSEILRTYLRLIELKRFMI